MKKVLFFIFVGSIFQFGNAQSLQKQTLAIQGSSHFVNVDIRSYYIVESIGQEGVINSFNANGHLLRQGFLQPLSASIISNTSREDIEALVYPNPFSEKVNIQFKESIIDVLHVTVINILGSIISTQQFAPTQSISLNLDYLSSGVYVLLIRMRSRFLQMKIIKR